MLYLVESTRTLKWIDLPSSILDVAREGEADFASLSWTPSDMAQVTWEGALRLALRYGAACSAGLIIDGEHASVYSHGDQIRQSLAESMKARAALRPHNDPMESLFPGWKQGSEELDQRVIDSSNDAADRADAEAAKMLAADVDGRLLQVWAALGGEAPSPL